MLHILNFVVFGLVSILTFFLAYFYASKRTPILAILFTFLGWVMSILIIGLLPLDIYMVLLFAH